MSISPLPPAQPGKPAEKPPPGDTKAKRFSDSDVVVPDPPPFEELYPLFDPINYPPGSAYK